MLSFPLIPPRDQSIWPTPTHLSSPPSPPSTHQPGHHSHHPNSHHPHHPHHPSSRRNPTAADGAYPHHSHHLLHAQHARPSPLALLRADERALAHRKQNIRRFGAGWIRPPGVQKTYQAAMEEAAEKEEQEVLARREREMLDLAAATEAGDGAGEGGLEAHPGEMGDGMGGGMDGQGDTGLGERDLDAEVPDADVDVDADEEGDSSLLEEIGVRGGDAVVGMEEEEMEHGSMVEEMERMREVELEVELEEGEMGVALEERDLDEEVPEAGSYEHTETEDEDGEDEDEEAQEEEDEEELGQASVVRMRAARMGLDGRRSLVSESGSPLLESSFVSTGSSPGAARGRARGHLLGRSRPQGRSPPD